MRGRESALYTEAREILQRRPLTAEDLEQLRRVKRDVDAVVVRHRAKKAEVPPRYPTSHDQLQEEGADVPGTLAGKLEFAQMRQLPPGTALEGMRKDGATTEQMVDALARERCRSGEFDLARHQQFLANLVSPHTPYRGVLLFHGVGTGKTCTAVNIAEQFPTQTKVVVITQQALASNFKTTVFDASRLRVDPRTGLVDLAHASNQCTGTKYLDVLPDAELSDIEAVRTRISSKISRRYRMFTTYIFAKHVRRKQERFPDTWPQKLRDEFSDHVFVVDEAHKLRVDADKEDYRHVSQAMRDVLSVTSNVRLLLLTATPMYNEAPDILEMFNLLLANDKMAPVSRAQMFDARGGVTGAGARLLSRLSRAYVSYLRGGDPFSFPVRLTPVDVRDPDAMPPRDPRQPTKNAAGKPIPTSERFRTTTLLRTPMSAYQARLYAESHHDADGPDAADTGTGTDADNSINSGFVTSTVVFPATHPSLATGSEAFRHCFDKGRGMTLSYSPRCPLAGFLAPPHLDTYAPKVSAVVKRACRAEGVVFVFSRYITMGALPLAIALEHLGFKRFGGTSMLSADPAEHRRWEERMPTEWKQLRRRVTERRWTYVVLSGDTNELSGSYAAEVEATRSERNLDGDVVKVVIATEKASEGMDLRNVREVHVLHPWFHQQKIEQIVGRSARMCSHIALPLEKRNVTVYLHAAVIGGRGGRETADVRAYRIAETKQHRIREAERVIAENAIDCHANRDVQFHDPAHLRLRFDLVSSQGVRIPRYALGDRAPATPVACATSPPPTAAARDASTYVPSLHVPDVRRCKSVFTGMFAKSPSRVAFTFDEVLSACRAHTSREVQTDSVAVAIQEVLEDHTTVLDARGRAGGVIYASDKYVFQPRDSFDMRDGLEDRRAAADDPGCEEAVFDMDANKKNQEVKKEPSRTSEKTSSSAAVSPAAVFRYVEDQSGVLRAMTERFAVASAQEDMERTRVDFVVDRLALPFQAKLVQHAFTVLKRKSRRGVGDVLHAFARHVLDSLEEGGVIVAMDGERGKAVLVDPSTGAHACVSSESSDTREPPEMCVRSSTTASTRTSTSTSKAAPASAVRGYLLPPSSSSPSALTWRTLFKARTVLEPGDRGVFKVLGDSKASSGFVCFQTSTVKSTDVVREISDVAKDSKLKIDGAALATADKRVLCHMYEVVLRYARPSAFLRPVEAQRVFGRNRGKRRIDI